MTTFILSRFCLNKIKNEKMLTCVSYFFSFNSKKMHLCGFAPFYMTTLKPWISCANCQKRTRAFIVFFFRLLFSVVTHFLFMRSLLNNVSLFCCFLVFQNWVFFVCTNLSCMYQSRQKRKKKNRSAVMLVNVVAKNFVLSTRKSILFSVRRLNQI